METLAAIVIVVAGLLCLTAEPSYEPQEIPHEIILEASMV